jgi:hypothetical protein
MADLELPLLLLSPAGSGREGFSSAGVEAPNLTSRGGVGGSNPAQTGTSEKASQPDDPFSPGEEELVVYLVGERQEWAAGLTFFGVAVPLARPEGAPAPLADLFLINGPGLTTGVDVLSPFGRSQGQREGTWGGSERGTLPPTLPTQAPVDESALNSFRMALEEIFRPDHLGGLPGEPGGSFDPSPPGPVPLLGLGDPVDQAVPPAREAEALQGKARSQRTSHFGETPAESFFALLLAFGPWRDSNRRGVKGLKQVYF